jgi:exonuclease SbcC
MRLDRLEIAGFMRFREPAVLDLREMPPGLIAILGGNGEGKTRLLDGPLAGLYGPGAQNNGFPSRPGPLVSYATTRDAYIETLWDIEGVGTYRSRVNVDGTRRESDAVLEQILPDGTHRPLNENGLVKTYRDAVARVFPSRRQVLASAFAAQNREGGFAALDQKGRLDLFTEMLDLRHLEDMGATAKRCAAACEKAVTALTTTIAALERDASEDQLTVARAAEAAARIALQAEEWRGPALVAAAAETEQRRAAAAAEVERQAVAGAAAEAVERMVQGFEHGLAQLDRTEQQVTDTAARDRLEAQDRRDAVRVALEKRRLATESRLDALRKDRMERIRGNAHLYANADKVRAAAAAVATANETAAAAADQERLLLQTLDGQRAILDTARAEWRAATKAQDLLAVAEQQTAVIATVPFGDRCAEAQCQFLTLATAAQETIPALRLTAATVPACAARVEGLEAEQGDTERQLAATRAELAAARQILADDTWAKYAADLGHIEERIEQYKAEIATAESEAEQADADRVTEQALAEVALAAALAGIQARLDAHLTRIATDRVTTRRQLQDAQADLQAAQAARAATITAREALATATAAARAAQDALARHGLDEARLDAAWTVAARGVAQVEAARARLAGLAERQRAAEDEWLVWRLLTQALGRDGLPKLEIDAAGPTISQLVGDLLAVGYGARFAVELTTQVERADKKGLKDEFAIRIFDNAYGGERDLSDLSGGERVVVEEALRAGILLFHNARQRRPIRTCWRDETTGALDPENVPRYVAMLRRMHALGGFRHTLFVTHSEAAAELADTVIRVAHGIPQIDRAA